MDRPGCRAIVGGLAVVGVDRGVVERGSVSGCGSRDCRVVEWSLGGGLLDGRRRGGVRKI